VAFTLACNSNSGQSDAGSGADADPPDVDVPHCDPSACPSGHCAPDGGCAAGCTDSSGCASGETCCNSAYCANLGKDPQNCGACGAACGAKQFCTSTACADAVVNNVCKNAAGAVVLDSYALDEDAGAAVGVALGSACSSTTTLTTIQQGATGSMDPQSGRPMLGPGNTYVAAGGGFGQKAVAYMNGARNAPVYTIDDSQSISFVRTSDNGTIIKTALASLTAHHDFFLIYAAAEPTSGTLVFAVYGLYGPGTTAGAFYFKTNMAGSLSSESKQYYVFEWTDTNNDGIPNAQDTFKSIESN
jgi:hypothetical protein